MALVEVLEPVTVKLPITVDEAWETRPWEVKRPAESALNKVVPAALRNRKKLPPKPVVLEATIKSPVVEVAFTWK